MPAPAGVSRPRAEGPAPYSLSALRALRRGWALIRWVALVLVVGVGTAALIAIGIASLVTLLESSV